MDDLFLELKPDVPNGEYRDPSKNWKGNTFDGDVYEEEKDVYRLSGQIEQVHRALTHRKWWTVEELIEEIRAHDQVEDPACSISAQIRNLRKKRFGSHVIEKQRQGGEDSALWEYQLQPKEEENEFDL